MTAFMPRCRVGPDETTWEARPMSSMIVASGAIIDRHGRPVMSPACQSWQSMGRRWRTWGKAGTYPRDRGNARMTTGQGDAHPRPGPCIGAAWREPLGALAGGGPSEYSHVPPPIQPAMAI